MKQTPSESYPTQQQKPADHISTLSQEQTTESNAIQIPEISLPKGGGALKGIDEKFRVNAVNGTGAISIPLPLTPGRNGFSPSLDLAYNSGSGNSPYGLGWSVGYPMIQRRTDKILPRYRDGHDEDIFMFSGIEDLVPYLEQNGENWIPRERTDNGLTVKEYRPRIEGSFDRIEKITANNEVYWKVTNQENTATFFGLSKEARLFDPEKEEKVFAWLPEFSYDDKGNWIRYEYKSENLENVPNSIHERNRHNGNAPFTNRYLKRVKYGNRVAFYNDSPYLPVLPDGNKAFFFELVMDYGEHMDTATEIPDYNEIQPWFARPDAFSTYRSGFEIRTYRQCQNILLFHHFPEEENHDGSDFGNAQLVRSLNLKYKSSSINNSGQSEVTYLIAITSIGYLKHAEAGQFKMAKKSLPPLEFEYEELNWNKAIKSVDSENIMNAPVGLTNGYQWVDLFGEGIAGILTEQAGAWFYKSNLGNPAEDQQVKFTAAQEILSRPSFLGFNNGVLSLQDLESNGEKQIVVNSPGVKGYFELTTDNKYKPFHSFETTSNLDLQDPNTRLLDLNGDGQPELVMTEEFVFTWYAADGKRGHTAAEFSPKPFDEEKGPAIVFKDYDRQEAIYLADMSGDGLTDIVRVRNGEICYWANMGFGRFSSKVNMSNAPIFDHSDTFNLEYLQFADVSGTGAADILYLAKNNFKAYINLSGNAWGNVHEIDPFFSMDTNAQISVVDLLGTGTSCIVWSSDLPGESRAPMRYIDLMSSKKPHLLIKSINNLGKETTLEYKSSTHFFIKDKLEGKPWITKLPFPVQVVHKSIIEEKITNVRFSTVYRYHHGYYDHPEKEFRGFGMVEQLDTEHYSNWKANNVGNQLEQSEELYQPPMLSKTWFHTGAFMDRERILNQFKEEYWYEEYNRLFPVFPLSLTEPQLKDAIIKAAPNLINPDIINQLSPSEWRGALRACKGMTLRQEVFALDAQQEGNTFEALQRQAKPYSVATHNCHVQLVQAKDANPYAVFTVTESEAISINYERNEKDPRISHTLNIKLDELGNVLETASVVYPRLLEDPSLPSDIQDEQKKTYISYSENKLTNDIISPNAYRLRLPFETSAYEITGLGKTTPLYQLSDFENILNLSTPLEYQEIASIGTEHRLIEQVRSLYYNNDLTLPLPLGLIESSAVPFENYQLAFTPNLLQTIYGNKIIDPNIEMTDGKFVHSENDDNWWIRSGLIQFMDVGETIADIQNRFYSPLSFTDPFGSTTKVNYYKDYFLLVEGTEDALNNKSTIESFDFRTLSPTLIRDINDNISAALFDELGLLKATALLGKDLNSDNLPDLELCDDLQGLSPLTENESNDIQAFFQTDNSNELNTIGARLLKQSGMRFVYDFEVYKNTGKPVVTSTIIRESHHHNLAPNEASKLQFSFEYSDGMGNVAMIKAQAEPGLAKQVVIQPDDRFIINEINTQTAFPDAPRLRWIGNGRTVLNNKGNPVKQYEPFFSISPHYEDLPELVETGVTPIIFYDAPGRGVKTLLPDESFTKVVFDSWKQSLYDQHDTILDSQWYQKRINNSIDTILISEGKDPAKEKAAAEKAANHADTPGVLHFDTLGRPFYSIAHNRDTINGDQFYTTRILLDIEGNTRAVIDARGNRVMAYQYDMLGHRIYENSMDKGERWMLNNVMGNPVKSWDSRNHIFTSTYDILQRPLEMKVEGGDVAQALNNIFEKNIYGEGFPNDKQNNFRGQLLEQYDTAGKIKIEQIDLKGNVLQSSRRFAIDYKNTVNWTGNLNTLLEPEVYTDEATYDALNRLVSSQTPDGSITTPTYNEANLLEQVEVNQNGNSQLFVKDINYDSKGQRKSITYGNDIKTTYQYDKATFRLLHLQSRKQSGELLQDLHYTFDPIGNISEIEDKAIPDVFFSNEIIKPVSKYTYDALYRLIEAEGREHSAQVNFGQEDNFNDLSFLKKYQANNSLALRNYTQRYQYDSVGNIEQMRHLATDGNWTRDYAYENNTNRLVSTKVGTNTYTYTHHPEHGYITELPHLEVMEWNFKDELQAVAKQRILLGTPETTYYVYDGEGERVRKITENQSANDAPASKKEERLYLGGIEIFKKISGANAGLERITLHIMDDTRRIAMIDTQNGLDPDTDLQTIRFQFGNHLGSASLEINENAEVISYEEYHPYGTTAYQATNANIRAAAKRYRYTGMERDEESGLNYHSARYYMVWLGRWLKGDPIGFGDGVNLYRYSNDNPVLYIDTNGEEAYILINTSGRKIDEATISTRKREIEDMPTFNKASDFVFVVEAYDLGKLEEKIEEITIRAELFGIGKTSEVSIYGHASTDGPVGKKLTSGKYAKDGKQLSIEGWEKIDFNWADDSNAYFCGCNTLEFAKNFLYTQKDLKTSAGYDVYSTPSLSFRQFKTDGDLRRESESVRDKRLYTVGQTRWERWTDRPSIVWMKQFVRSDISDIEIISAFPQKINPENIHSRKGVKEPPERTIILENHFHM